MARPLESTNMFSPILTTYTRDDKFLSPVAAPPFFWAHKQILSLIDCPLFLKLCYQSREVESESTPQRSKNILEAASKTTTSAAVKLAAVLSPRCDNAATCANQSGERPLGWLLRPNEINSPAWTPRLIARRHTVRVRARHNSSPIRGTRIWLHLT
jgi:hypothetical protein